MVKSRRSASRLPVAAEAHLGVAAEGLDVLAQRRHLERPAVDHHGDGAVLDAGRHRLEARGLGAPDHLVRHGGGGDVDLADRLAEQRVAHRAADHARLLAVAVEHVEQPRQRALAQPRGARGASGRHVSLRPPRHELAVLDMRRLVGRARRRAGEMRESTTKLPIIRTSAAMASEARTFGGQDASVSNAALVATR